MTRVDIAAFRVNKPQPTRRRDNGAPTWRCKTTRSPKDLERLFRQDEVAGLLQERVGAIFGTRADFKAGVCYLQLLVEGHTPRHRQEDFDLLSACLNEIGVMPIETQRKERTE